MLSAPPETATARCGRASKRSAGREPSLQEVAGLRQTGAVEERGPLGNEVRPRRAERLRCGSHAGLGRGLEAQPQPVLARSRARACLTAVGAPGWRFARAAKVWQALSF